MPCFLAALYSSTEPFITPWSVSPSAGCPKAAARSTSPSILQAPSSSEYSEWTWRCATFGGVTGRSQRTKALRAVEPATELDCGRGVAGNGDRAFLRRLRACEQREHPVGRGNLDRRGGRRCVAVPHQDG